MTADISRALEASTPRKGSTISWGRTPHPGSMKSVSSGQYTTAMKVYIPWWKRKTFWTLVGFVSLLLAIQIEVDTSGSISGIVHKIFNWVRTQPWVTAAIAGGLGYFIRDRAIALIPRHEILSNTEDKK